MLEISSKTNLLEQKSYKYSLQDVAEPNLQRDVYSYGTIPKVAFNHRRVPMSMPEEIWITDTSLRDGQQSVEPYSVDQIVNIYKLLSKLGGPYGIIRQTEFFIYSKKDREAIEKCMALDLKFPEITSWIRATKEDFQLVHDLGIKETGILVSCSDYHIFKKMKMTRRQAMDYYLATVKEAFNAGVIPRCHLEDITRADFYGFVVPFVNELQRLSREAGVPVKIRACDTMGYGVPFTEAALPRSVAGIIYGLQHYSDVPSEHLEWHGHNDFYKGVANASTAWLYGACAVNCSLLGIGERTGTNASAVFDGGYTDERSTPLYPFGFGLGYTTFSVEELTAEQAEVPTDGTVVLRCTVTNTGARPGSTVVQLYFRDMEAHVTRPVRQLCGYLRVRLEPGQSARVTFRVDCAQLGFTNENNEFVVEPGGMEFKAGQNSEDLPACTQVTLTGKKRDLAGRRSFTSRAEWQRMN